MSGISYKVRSIIEGDSPSGAPERLLRCGAFVYGICVRLRASLYRKEIVKSRRLPVPVISIGNITVGGTGKTPMTLFLAEALKRKGLHAVILSRGYRGRAEKEGGVVSDGERILMNAEDAGDEPFMMAVRLPGTPVVVGRDRVAGGLKAVRLFQPDVILLDDGFQHLRLKRDLNLVLLDAVRPFGNGYLLPGGPLREPLPALNRADAFVLTRCEERPDAMIRKLNRIAPGRPVFCASHVPLIREVLPAECGHGDMGKMEKNLAGRRVFLFSGIAKNEDLKRSAEELGGEIAGFAAFADHHFYSDADLDTIRRQALASGADIIATTAKDQARFQRQTAWPLALAVLDVGMELMDPFSDFISFVVSQLNRAVHGPSPAD